MNMSNVATELSEFHQFIGKRLETGVAITPDEALEEFRRYREELERLREMIRAAEESIARGEAKPLDADALIRRVRERLALEGIVD